MSIFTITNTGQVDYVLSSEDYRDVAFLRAHIWMALYKLLTVYCGSNASNILKGVEKQIKVGTTEEASICNSELKLLREKRSLNIALSVSKTADVYLFFFRGLRKDFFFQFKFVILPI